MSAGLLYNVMTSCITSVRFSRFSSRFSRLLCSLLFSKSRLKGITIFGIYMYLRSDWKAAHLRTDVRTRFRWWLKRSQDKKTYHTSVLPFGNRLEEQVQNMSKLKYFVGIRARNTHIMGFLAFFTEPHQFWLLFLCFQPFQHSDMIENIIRDEYGSI